MEWKWTTSVDLDVSSESFSILYLLLPGILIVLTKCSHNNFDYAFYEKSDTDAILIEQGHLQMSLGGAKFFLEKKAAALIDNYPPFQLELE